MSGLNRASVRGLYPWEIEEARRIFDDRLNYQKVRVHEGTTWTNAIDRIGRRLRRMEAIKTQNAITLGYHCFFPVRLPSELLPAGHPEHYKLCWLIHELTHAWQYQRLGWRYLYLALRTQFREKGVAYDFGGAEGLKLRRAEQWTLHRFNLEQQGDITRAYYERLQRGEDVTDWLPYIDDIQKG